MRVLQNILAKSWASFQSFRPASKVAIVSIVGGGIAGILAWRYMYKERKQKKDEKLLEHFSSRDYTSSKKEENTEVVESSTESFITRISNIRTEIERVITNQRLSRQDKIGK